MSRWQRPMVLIGIFWGAVWGIWEATVGFLVHNFVHVPGAASVLLVPFGLYCMMNALSASRTIRSVAVVAVTAASVKLIDFVLGPITVVSVVHPTVAILLEALAFVLVATVMNLPATRWSLQAYAGGALAFNAIWRVLFVVNHALIGLLFSASAISDGLRFPLGFLVRDSFLNAAIVVALVALARARERDGGRVRPLPTPRGVALVLTVAILVEAAGRLL